MRRFANLCKGEGDMTKRVTPACANCGVESKCRHRDFNPQVWSLLLQWGEVDESIIDQPICDSCYADIREILIERSAEMEQAFASGVVDITQAQNSQINKTNSDTRSTKRTLKVQKAS